MSEKNTQAKASETARTLPALAAPIGVAAILLLLVFVGTSKVLLRPHLVFAFNDGNIESALSPAYQLPGCFLQIWDNQTYFGKGGHSTPLSLTNMLASALGPHGYRREGVVIAIWLTGLAGFWSFRLWGRSRTASFLAAILFMLCGWTFTFPAVGLPVRSFTLACTALSLGWMKRGIRRSDWLSYIVAGGFLGLAVTDTADVGILCSLCCGATFVYLHLSQVENGRRPPQLLRSGAKLTLYIVVSLLMAYQTILAQIGANVKGMSQGSSRSSEDRYEWATQWSLPKAETWSLFATDYHGASSRSTTSPYWGRMGQSRGWDEHRQGFRNFRLAGYAVGAVPIIFLALLFSVTFRRRDARSPYLDEIDRYESWWFGLLALVCLAMSWGYHFPLYRLFYSLPYMGTIRNPDKWLGPFTLFLTLGFASSIDLALRMTDPRDTGEKRRILKWASGLTALVPLIALIGLISLNRSRATFLARLGEQGYGGGATIAWSNAVEANTQIIIVCALSCITLWTCLGFWKASPGKARGAIVVCTTILLAFELLKANAPFVIPHNYQHILEDNTLTAYLDQRKMEGRVKILPPQQPLLNNWRNTYLTARGYDLFDPVSAARIPNDYKTLFEALGKDPARLWGLGAVRHIVCTTQLVPQLQQLSRRDAEFIHRGAFGVRQIAGGHYVPEGNVPDNQKGLSIVEFTGARPFLGCVPAWDVFPDSPEGDLQAIDRLKSASFDWSSMAVVQGDISPSTASSPAPDVQITDRRSTETHARVTLSSPALLVRASRYSPSWVATVNGERQPLLRVNYLFQGILLPAGDHKIEFLCRADPKPLVIAVVGKTLFLLLLGISLFKRSPKTRKT
jgi:hypothetical protein